MVTPRWVRTRVQPIAIRDVLRFLVGVLADGSDDDHLFDIGGSDVSRRDAEIAGREPSDPYPGDPQWSGGTLRCDIRTAAAAASPAQVFAAVTRVGGERGWPSFDFLWEVRGLLDRLVGGVGLRRGRRDPDHLRVGDALDFWRVEELRTPDEDGVGLLRLRAEMRVPGRAWLEWRITPEGEGSTLTQRALFAPRGLWGRVYWWLMAPFHPPIFASMVTALARAAEQLARAADQEPPVSSSGEPTAPPAGLGEGGGGPDQPPPPSRRAG
jgi:hypothetical protein